VTGRARRGPALEAVAPSGRRAVSAPPRAPLICSAEGDASPRRTCGICESRSHLGSMKAPKREGQTLSTERPGRILIVEDNSEVMAVLRELLLRNGYDVQEARHGAEALVQLSAPKESLPDLVILDIGLPLEGGVGVLAFMRRTVHTALPVIVLTASASHAQEQEIQQLGVSAYLRKPASSDLLLAEVKRALAAQGRTR